MRAWTCTGAWRILAIMALTAVASCQKSALARRVDATIFAWAQCTDCMHRQRERVVALGDTAVPRLAQLLALGPPKSHDSAYVASLLRLAQRSPMTPEILQHQRENFAAVYRRRALIALRDIGTAPARRSLCLARTTTPATSPVRLAIDSVIAQINAPCP